MHEPQPRVVESRRRWPLGAALLHFAVALPLAVLLNVWTDEVYSLTTSSGSLANTVSRAMGFELQPPFYYVLLNLWGRLLAGAFGARMLSVLCTTGAVVVVGVAARRWAGARHVPWVTLVFAMNPFVVWAAVEARPYALALLFTATLVWLFHRAFLDERGSRLDRAVYTGLSILALYTQYYLGFVLLAQGVALVATGRFRATRDYLLWMALAGTALVPLVAFAPLQAAAQGSTTVVQPLPQFATELLRRVDNYLFAWTESPFPRPVRWLFRLAILGLLTKITISAGLRAWRRLEPCPLLAVVVGTLIACFVAAQSRVGAENMIPRHTLSLLPTSLLFVAVLAGASGTRRLPVLLGVLMLALSSTALFWRYRDLAKTGDHVRVAAHIQAHETPRERILVFPADVAIAFAHHYRGPNQVLAIPSPASFDTYDPRRFALTSEEELTQRLGTALAGCERVWLVTIPMDAIQGVDLNREILESVVARDFVLLSTRTFFQGVTVRHLQARSSR